MNIIFLIILGSPSIIGQYSFSNCIKLEYVSIPSDVREFESDVFNNCISIKTIKLLETEKLTIRNRYFYASGLIEITIPENIIEIFDYAFSGEKIFRFIIRSFLGENNPTYGEKIFYDTDIGVYVTSKYQDVEFCSYNVSFIPTNHFSESELFSKSEAFSLSNEFSSSFSFSPNKQKH